MKDKRVIRVLVVDDSMVFRESIKREIEQDPMIEVIGLASDPYGARDIIVREKPDVMTLDVQMPKMNGIEFLRQLMPQYPLPVVVVSAVNDSVFEAISAGAVDFVAKPDYSVKRSTAQFFKELTLKIKIASTARVKQTEAAVRSAESHQKIIVKKDMVIAIGASTGGPEALGEIIGALGGDVPGIVIVQHMPPVFTRMFAERLNSRRLEVREAADGDVIRPGLALIAPGGMHMAVGKRNGACFVKCYEGDRVNNHRPSVDVLFGSVARAYGKNAIGVILTGMGHDGAKGLLEMRKNGARTIGQDQQSCVVYGMPKVAYNIGGVEVQKSLKDIAGQLYLLLGEQ